MERQQHVIAIHMCVCMNVFANIYLREDLYNVNITKHVKDLLRK